MHKFMQFFEFTSCKADPDVWMHKAGKEDEITCWKYILIYTNDVLVVSYKPIDVVEEIGKYFKLEENSTGPPKLYLGGMVSKREVHSYVTGKFQALGFSSSQYVQSAVNNVVKYLKHVK